MFIFPDSDCVGWPNPTVDVADVERRQVERQLCMYQQYSPAMPMWGYRSGSITGLFTSFREIIQTNPSKDKFVKV